MLVGSVIRYQLTSSEYVGSILVKNQYIIITPIFEVIKIHKIIK